MTTCLLVSPKGRCPTPNALPLPFAALAAALDERPIFDSQTPALTAGGGPTKEETPSSRPALLLDCRAPATQIPQKGRTRQSGSLLAIMLPYFVKARLYNQGAHPALLRLEPL